MKAAACDRRVKKLLTRFHNLEEAHRTLIREHTHEKARADRAIKDGEVYAKAIADKNEGMERLRATIELKNNRIAELMAERDRFVKVTNDFTTFLNGLRALTRS